MNLTAQSALWLLIFTPQPARHHKMRLGCRLNAGGVEWVERHGCRESAVRTWMSVRRVPTERRRIEDCQPSSSLSLIHRRHEKAPAVIRFVEYVKGAL